VYISFYPLQDMSCSLKLITQYQITSNLCSTSVPEDIDMTRTI